MLRLMIMTGTIFLLTGCASRNFTLPPDAPVTYLNSPEQCVPYARRISGIEIYGDAYTWWDRAGPRYVCGNIPQPGAVLVLARTSKMPEGHLAVVNAVINPRLIDVTQSNWGNDRASRKVLYHSMKVEDVSPNNSWTSVRFWNFEKNVFGFPYEAKGFIYK